MTHRDEAGFIAACGSKSCARALHQRDMEFVETPGLPDCSNCKGRTLLQDMLGELDEPTVVREMGWCVCGNPATIDRLMLGYLDKLGDDVREPIAGDAEMLCAYMADWLGWTEHGGSVYGSWRTALGDKVRDRLKALVQP